MERLYKAAGDFVAAIRIFTPQEGGRIQPAFNGLRWNFSYAEDHPTHEIFMIWPDFIDASGNSLYGETCLSAGIPLMARMTVADDSMREKVHRHRIRSGVEFYCHESSQRVASGRVIEVTGLHDERKAR